MTIIIDPKYNDLPIFISNAPKANLDAFFTKGVEYPVLTNPILRPGGQVRNYVTVRDNQGIRRFIGVGIGAGNGFLRDASGNVVDFIFTEKKDS